MSSNSSTTDPQNDDDGDMRDFSVQGEAPDFENPGDSDRDNVYEVTVVVSDGVNDSMVAVTVKVTNIEEDEEENRNGVTPVQPRVGMKLTAVLKDSDGIVTGPTWEMARCR